MTPYYDVDGITIYHGDCADVLPTIDPDDVALVLTDPPYGIGQWLEESPIIDALVDVAVSAQRVDRFLRRGCLPPLSDSDALSAALVRLEEVRHG